MINGTCLCGNVSFTFDGSPEKLVNCNCTACRRYRGLWAHGPLENITITENGPAIRYTRGDESLAFVTCATCGCTTHWEPVNEETSPGFMAVNMALAEPADIKDIRIRLFDGFDSWEFLD